MSNTRPTFDVAVIGAGPAGSSAAYHLARNHRRVVLLERSTFPRDKACGDGLTGRSVELLEELGLTATLASYQKVHGTRIITDTRGFRDLSSARPGRYGLVVPRLDLDHLIAQRAVHAGVVLWQETRVIGPILNGDRVSGVRVDQRGVVTEIAATFVVVADGANSPFARTLGLLETDPWSKGYAVRGYFTNVLDANALFNFYVPLIDPDGGRSVAGYGWIFPLRGGEVNAGVGFIPTQRQELKVNLRQVFEHFVQTLRKRDARFADMTLIGRLSGAPLPCGLNLSRCVGHGVLLVGDAAGLVNPFTGEGIDTALESGKLAAQVLEDALASRHPTSSDLRDYSRLLAEHYRDCFKAGRTFTRTHKFLWKVLESTFDIRRPLFDNLRRAVVDFGTGEDRSRSHARGHGGVWPRAVADGVRRARGQLVTTIESEFPMLSRVCPDLMTSVGSLLRANLVFLAGEFGGPGESQSIAVATSLQLMYLALLMHSDVLDSAAHDQPVAAPRPTAGLHWGNMFSVMAGDYLLMKAYEVSVHLGSDISRVVSRSSADVCAAKLREASQAHRVDLTDDLYDAIIEKKTAILYELACQLGAKVRAGPPALVNQLAEYGRNLGLAFELTDEILVILTHSEDPLQHPLARMLEEGTYSWPVLCALRSHRNGDLRTLLQSPGVSEDQVRRALTILRGDASLTHALARARRFASRAKRRLSKLPLIPARRSLAVLADFVIDRVGAEAARSPHHGAGGDAGDRVGARGPHRSSPGSRWRTQLTKQ